jgi:cytoskeletal protein CcmA (bactofilin family)
MFSRKRTETEEPKMADASDDLGIPMKPARLASSPNPVTVTKPAAPPRAPDLARSGDPARPGDSVRAPEPARRPSEPPLAAPARRIGDSEVRKLIVGRDITLSGEITSCEKLIIEGSVEANLSNCRDVDIAETGLFKGSAAVEEAEIRGRFEGNLTVKKRLSIRASGRVAGTVRYGQIEIECGGQISGDIQLQPEPGLVAPGSVTPGSVIEVASVRAAE